MALIKCPECGKEISDQVKKCPNCGYPLRKTNGKKIVTVAVAVIGIGVIASIAYNHLVIKPKKVAEQNAIYENAMNKVDTKEFDEALELLSSIPEYENIDSIINEVKEQKDKVSKYEQGTELLEKGKYEEGIELLNSISDYEDVSQILEEAKYESYAYSAVEAVKGILKNPDSLNVLDIYFFETSSSTDEEVETENVQEGVEEQGNYPYIILHISAQNGFGGITTSYAGCSYTEEKQKYELDGYTDTLDEEELDEDDDDYWFYLLSTTMFNVKFENGKEVGTINRERFNSVLKSYAYTAVKIIE